MTTIVAKAPMTTMTAKAPYAWNEQLNWQVEQSRWDGRRTRPVARSVNHGSEAAVVDVAGSRRQQTILPAGL